MDRKAALPIVAVLVLAAVALLVYAIKTMSGGPSQSAARPGPDTSALTLHDLARRGDAAGLTAALAKAGANVDAPLPGGEATQTGTTPLMSAAAADKLDAVRVLLQAGAKPDTATPDGRTALLLATRSASAPVVSALLQGGATVDVRTPDGVTPLIAAGDRGDPAILEAILAAGPAVDARTESGLTALMAAAQAGHADAVIALLDAGASINAETATGDTALALAAGGPGEPRVIEVLLEAGALVDGPNREGVTPLMRAAQRDDLDKVLALLNAGASATLKDASGRTARDWAVAGTPAGTPRCAETLAEAERK